MRKKSYFRVKAPRFSVSVYNLCGALSTQGETFIKGVYDIDLMTMTDIDTLANQLQSLSVKDLQKVLLATSNRDGSAVRAARNSRTEKYFEHAPKPHQCLTFGVYSDTVDYIHEIGIDKWLSQKVNNRTKNATFVTVRRQ